jgi:hypothetical protein
MSSDAIDNTPDLIAYAVTEIGTQRTSDEPTGHWQRIGAAWVHKDQNGFNLQLTCLPINGTIVLRVPKPALADVVSDEAEPR